MLTWSIWTSCPQLPPALFMCVRLARPITPAPLADDRVSGYCRDGVTTIGLNWVGVGVTTKYKHAWFTVKECASSTGQT